MKDSYATIIITVAIAILAYFNKSQLCSLDGHFQRSESIKESIHNGSLISNINNYSERNEEIIHQSQKQDQRKFYQDHFSKYFNVRLTHELITDESIQDLVDAHDIYRHEVYLNAKQSYDTMAEVFGPYIEDFLRDDRRFYVAFCGPEKGYGVFAAVDILKDSYIGEYTGMLTNKSANTDYAWTVKWKQTYYSMLRGKSKMSTANLLT
jgi:hypothetical protein